MASPSSRAKVEAICREIVARFGFVPPFFEPAFDAPEVLENLWQQTLSAYVDNPLPAIFKESLFALTSQACSVPYCIVSHSCALRPLGLQTSEILALLEAPLPEPSEYRELLDTAIESFPERGSPLYQSVLWAAVSVFFGEDLEQLRPALRRVLGPFHPHLVALTGYIKTCHEWVEAHPELSYEADARARENLGPLLDEEPRLSQFFVDYHSRFQQARSRRQLLATNDAARRLAFLAAAGEMLASSPDYASTLRHVAKAAVPSIADVCIVDLVDGDRIERVAEMAAREEENDALAALAREYPATADSPAPAARVIRSGVPELLPVVDRDVIAAHTRDARHRELIEKLALRSHLAVPIRAGDRVLGAISLGFSRSGRSYSAADVSLAEELARRAASAIELAQSFRDVRRARETAEASEKRYRSLIVATAQTVWATNAAGVVVDDSPSWRAFTGQSVEQWLAQRWFDAVHPDDRARARGTWEDAVRTGSPFECEYRLRRHDGVYRAVLARAVPVKDDDGAIREWIGVNIDVQDQRALEDRLRSESEINEVLYQVGAAFARELDTKKLVQLVTDEATKLVHAEFGAFFFNVTDEKHGKYLLYTLSGAPPEAFSSFPVPRATPLFGKTFRGEGTVRCDDVREHPAFGAWGPQPKGHLPVVSYLAVPVIAASGEVLGGLFFGHGERARFNERHERLVVGLAGQAAAALQNATLYEALRVSEERARNAYEVARAADRRKDEFLAMLGHELRNPLAPIVTALRLLRLRAGDAFGREHEIIERQVQHLVRLVDDLLDVERITRGKIELTLVPMEIASAVDRALEMASPLFEQKRHHVAVRVARTGLRVRADEARLSQIVANLLTNAAKYTPDGGHIEVSATRENDQIVLQVRDDGLGISAELLPHVFDIFMQGERTIDRSAGGLGIGLTLVRNLVAMHNGSVSAASDGPGRGSSFTVRLPAIHAEALERSVSVEPPAKAPVRSRCLRILIVDDNENLAETLSIALDALGHRVTVAFDAVRALELAAQSPPDVAVLDLGLPVMDGFELGRRLVEAHGPGLRLIALSGYGQPSDRARTREAGFHEHLVKPVDLDVLERALASAADVSR